MGIATCARGRATCKLPELAVRGQQTDRVEVAPMITPRVLESQCEWTAADVADEESWTERFTEAELDELDASLHHALQRSSEVLELTRADFPLPALASRLADIER